jgi:cell division septum initiation protein DivIVA
MQADQIKSGIERAEACADDAKRALQQSQSAPQELRQSVESLHQQLSQAKKQGQMGEDSLRDVVLQAEQSSDRAMAACRNAGDSVDPQLQQAVKRTHQELSNLKKEIQMQ